MGKLCAYYIYSQVKHNSNSFTDIFELLLCNRYGIILVGESPGASITDKCGVCELLAIQTEAKGPMYSQWSINRQM